MKEFCMRIRMDDDGGVTIDGTNAGFTVIELIGLLDLKKYDLLKQADDPTSYTRTAKRKNGEEVVISEKEDIHV